MHCQYYGAFDQDQVYVDDTDGSFATPGLQISYCNYIFISNNIFSGYDAQGLIWIVDSSNILFIANELNIDTSGLYYDILLKYLKIVYAPLYYLRSSDITIIDIKSVSLRCKSI